MDGRTSPRNAIRFLLILLDARTHALSLSTAFLFSNGWAAIMKKSACGVGGTDDAFNTTGSLGLLYALLFLERPKG